MFCCDLHVFRHLIILQEKLSLDQLTIDLHAGRCSIHNVALDVFAVNELLHKSSVPVEVLEGFVQQITVSSPWREFKEYVLVFTFV